MITYHGIKDGKYDVTIDGERKLLDPVEFLPSVEYGAIRPNYTGAGLIVIERVRQIKEEGWTPEHDAEHTAGQLADAAASYAMSPDTRKTLTIFCKESDGLPPTWPWDGLWWKPCPNDRIRELVKAGALIAAEIDRLMAVTDLETKTRIMDEADAAFARLRML